METNQIGHRIKLARKREGLSLRDLSERMGRLVSAQALGKYERGEMLPGSQALISLSKALRVSLGYLLARKNTRLGAVDFRKKARTSKKDQARVEAEVLSHVERDLELDELLGHDSDKWQSPFLTKLKLSAPEKAEDVANELREKWRLGINPIPDVTELLEEKGLKILVVDLPENVSGLTCLVQRDRSPEVPVIVVNRTHSLERRRLTLLHELGHRIFEIAGDEKGTERAANHFAGALLVHAEHLDKQLFSSHRQSFGAREILTLKKVYRTSAAALWYRIKQLGYITESQYEYGCRTFARGWRGKREPEGIEAETERGSLEMPSYFQRKCHWALAEGHISLLKASELLEKPVSVVESEFKGAS